MDGTLPVTEATLLQYQSDPLLEVHLAELAAAEVV